MCGLARLRRICAPHPMCRGRWPPAGDPLKLKMRLTISIFHLSESTLVALSKRSDYYLRLQSKQKDTKHEANEEITEFSKYLQRLVRVELHRHASCRAKGESYHRPSLVPYLHTLRSRHFVVSFLLMLVLELMKGTVYINK